MQCKEWDDANSELFKEAYHVALDKNTYEIRFCELISASLVFITMGVTIVHVPRFFAYGSE